jgi:hypothetical protein
MKDMDSLCGVQERQQFPMISSGQKYRQERVEILALLLNVHHRQPIDLAWYVCMYSEIAGGQGRARMGFGRLLRLCPIFNHHPA